jgi:uncharacterized glyoxalase superfamily protein PhnB
MGSASRTPPLRTCPGRTSTTSTHFAHAKAAGAKIVSEIQQHGYRAYTAEDLEGRRWTFAQARPTMA